MIRMPGVSFSGPLPPLSIEEQAGEATLRSHVEQLAGAIGERNVARYEALSAAADFLAAALARAGYEVSRLGFPVEGKTCYNVEVERAGAQRPEEIVVVGAHYDSVLGCPGANDNASGVAALLVLAERFAQRTPERTLRFVAFVNEEPPWFQTEAMGSAVYANQCRQRGDRVVAMLSLETLGCYSDEEGSQQYPAPFGLFYPSRGNFVGFVGNVGSRALVRKSIETFRDTVSFPSEGGALPSFVPGVGWSDHWAFWQAGYPAIMVTDTAPFRYAHYHRHSDTPDKVQYDRLARVVTGLEGVVTALAGGG
jgi:Zn-dependent M28 family amino/carboxypeptidase